MLITHVARAALISIHCAASVPLKPQSVRELVLRACHDENEAECRESGQRAGADTRVPSDAHTHTRTHARTHARACARPCARLRTHARTHELSLTHTHTTHTGALISLKTFSSFEKPHRALQNIWVRRPGRRQAQRPRPSSPRSAGAIAAAILIRLRLRPLPYFQKLLSRVPLRVPLPRFCDRRSVADRRLSPELFWAAMLRV